MRTKPQPKVFAIVINDSSKEKLLSALNGLYFSNYENLEIVLLDNNLSDGSFEAARRLFPKTYSIKNFKKTLCSGDLNIAIRLALEKLADYVLIMKSSVSMEKNSLLEMVAAAETSEKIGLVGPTIFDLEKSRVFFAGGKIFWKKRQIHKKTGLVMERFSDSDYALREAMLVRKSVFQKIGLFDEKFSSFYGDIDFSWRAKKASLQIAISRAKAFVQPSSRMTVKRLASAGSLTDSKDLFFNKCSSPIERVLSKFLTLR